eukprot:TRINITY_DN40074_c0_g1_i1.p1 TRINITY_DN40074_c0_g1~~TRINITY_DN40074_c0_g1_i1.p1  ORF type:complete len:694 (+),score=89.73 TRINITY_DN40074_c0_g1_i1:96-2084(+)
MAFGDPENGVIHRVGTCAPKSLAESIGGSVKETLFPDDPFRQFKSQTAKRKWLLAAQYVFPILEWGPKYSLSLFRSDLISGLTIASLAIPQGISYAKLANLPPILGLYSSFVPPLIYSILGSSRDLAVGTVAVVSLLLGSMLGKEVPPVEHPALYLQLAFTVTLVSGIFQASLGIFRLGFIIDFLSHAAIVGFMSGAATVVSLQQLKGVLGLHNFTKETDIVAVLRSVLTQTHKWRWESIVLAVCFLSFLLVTRQISKKTPRLFWVSAASPLTSVIAGSLLVFLTRAERHGVDIVGDLKRGLNPLSVNQLVFKGEHLKLVLKTGIISGILTLAEGIAVGRSFALIKNYQIDGNKEMIAIGTMNIIGSCTSCYVTSGAFSRSAVNVNAGCKTAVSNIVMSLTVMTVLLFLTPLFHYTPLVILSVIIVSAMLGLIDIQAFCHLWKVDKLDFLVCMGAYLGVVFLKVETGLIIAVALSMLRVILHVTRPHTAVLGNIPNTNIFRNTEQYPEATTIPGILVLRIDAPIYFTNSSYLRERIVRWIEDEEERLRKLNAGSLQYVILDLSPVTCVDATGINMLEELKKTLESRNLQMALSNPVADVMEKLERSKFREILGEKWIFVNAAEAVEGCQSLLEAHKADKCSEASHIEMGLTTHNDKSLSQAN